MVRRRRIIALGALALMVGGSLCVYNSITSPGESEAEERERVATLDVDLEKERELLQIGSEEKVIVENNQPENNISILAESIVKDNQLQIKPEEIVEEEVDEPALENIVPEKESLNNVLLKHYLGTVHYDVTLGLKVGEAMFSMTESEGEYILRFNVRLTGATAWVGRKIGVDKAVLETRAGVINNRLVPIRYTADAVFSDRTTHDVFEYFSDLNEENDSDLLIHRATHKTSITRGKEVEEKEWEFTPTKNLKEPLTEIYNTVLTPLADIEDLVKEHGKNIPLGSILPSYGEDIIESFTGRYASNGRYELGFTKPMLPSAGPLTLRYRGFDGIRRVDTKKVDIKYGIFTVKFKERKKTKGYEEPDWVTKFLSE